MRKLKYTMFIHTRALQAAAFSLGRRYLVDPFLIGLHCSKLEDLHKVVFSVLRVVIAYEP